MTIIRHGTVTHSKLTQLYPEIIRFEWKENRIANNERLEYFCNCSPTVCLPTNIIDIATLYRILGQFRQCQMKSNLLTYTMWDSRANPSIKSRAKWPFSVALVSAGRPAWWNFEETYSNYLVCVLLFVLFSCPRIRGSNFEPEHNVMCRNSN